MKFQLQKLVIIENARHMNHYPNTSSFDVYYDQSCNIFCNDDGWSFVC